jgi:1-acyl-sn-glycerol-3-phosphate acyltransferase
MSRPLALRTWLGTFGLLRRYLRYEVVGLERLLTPGAKLLVAYHGRPMALDLCMLSVTMHERLGYLPHGIFHASIPRLPLAGRMMRELGFVTGDGPELGEAVQRGEHICVQPGGTREGCRSFRHRYRVSWGERTGYLRLAMKYRLPILPLAADGVDDLYLGLNDGYALGKRLRMPGRLPVWLGLGATGVWPLALPFPVKVTQYVGEPFEAHLRPGLDVRDGPALLALHRQVAASVQGLLNQARSRDAT